MAQQLNPGPGIEDILAPDVEEVRERMTALENAIGQDDHEDSWDDTVGAVGDLLRAVEALDRHVSNELRKRDF